MPPFRQTYIPIVEISIALMIILLPLSNNADLMNGIQTAKSFNFFYSVLALAGISSIALLFRKNKLQFNITIIDILLLAYVIWVTINKYLVHDVYCFSLKYYELLGLSVLYIIIRLINKKYYLLFLVAICISGTIQAVYGCLQLWGYYPSNHGLFKMTGSFFNPGPYAGFLAIILPIAVGLYWSFNKVPYSKFHIPSFKFSNIAANLKPVTWNLKRSMAKIGEAQPESEHTGDRRSQTSNLKRLTSNLQPVIIKYIALSTIISILLALPAARSRAAWLGALAGCLFLAWHKFKLGQLFKRQSNQTIKLFKHIVKIKNRTIITILILLFVAGGLSLYHYKKDSADGRMLIWTITSNIIKDYPLFGVGQDMFQAHYMDYQADYFRNHTASKFETVADDNKYAFNEFLNTWAENGTIGFLLMAGLVFVLFFKNTKHRPLNVALNEQPVIWNLKPESERSVDRRSQTCNLQLEIILKASLLAILVFGLFAYPSEILVTKLILLICLGIYATIISKKVKILLWGQAEIWNLNRSIAKIGESKPALIISKFSIAVITLVFVYILYPKSKELETAYKIWKDAFDLYQYGLYEECLEDFVSTNKHFNTNGEFLINYGKALSIAKKHDDAIEVLESAQSYLTNTVLYTALGDSHKELKDYEKAEGPYLQAKDMVPDKFYPQYLLAKLYDESQQKLKAIEVATALLNKEIKIESTAIEEIKEEMKRIISNNSKEESQILSKTINYRQKGKDNQTLNKSTVRLPCPKHFQNTTLQTGEIIPKGGDVTKV